MSKALQEREGVDSKGAGADVSPLLDLLGQGDAAAAAACSILTGMALDRPLVVIPEVGLFLVGLIVCWVGLVDFVLTNPGNK